MSKMITDQQKIGAVNILLDMHGEEDTAKFFKDFLFRAQGVFIRDRIEPEDPAGDAMYLLYHFFDELEPKEKAG